MSPVRIIKTKIGELLLQRSLITNEQLQEALSLQHSRLKGKPLGQILIESGFINKDDLYHVLAIQKGYPYINIKQCNIEPYVLSLIPEDMVKRYQVCPIDKIEEILTVAMVNPLDELALSDIKKFTKKNIKIFLTTFLELKEATLKYYGRK